MALKHNSLLAVLKVFIFGGSLCCFYNYAGDSLSRLDLFELGLAGLLAIFVLSLFHCVIVGWGGVVWAALLVGLGSPVSYPRMVSIYSLTQFAKYLPGNVMHHLGRISMAKLHGVEVRKVTSSLGIEILSVIFVSFLCSFFFLVYLDKWSEYVSVPEFSIPQVIFAAIGVLVVMVLGWFVWKKGLHLVIRKLAIFDFPPFQVLVKIVAGYFVSFVAMGLLNSILATWVFGAPFVNPLLMTGAFALAWVVGFVTPGAPGGLGVREAVLLVSLGPLLGTEVAAGLSIVLRVVTTLGDGLAFLLALVFAKKIGKKNVGFMVL